MTERNGIIYCRVSSQEQVDGTSLESQERMCREYAKRENIAVLDVFIDRGESAKTADRTEFIKAISFCSQKKNKVDTFIVYKIDRFARNQFDHMSVRETLRKYGTELRSVTEPIDSTPMGKMMEGILSTFAEFDNNVRTERSTNGMRERLKQGIWVWPAPIGYKRLEKGGTLVSDERYARYIQMAFEEYSHGTYTYEALARLLNERGFRTAKGAYGIPQLMEKMLKNPLYCGMICVWGMELKGAFEPLVSQELFNKCQVSGRRHKAFKMNAQNPTFPLRKLVICFHCKAPITGSSSTGHKGIKYPYYHHHKQNCEYADSIPKATLEKKFTEYLKEISPNFEYEKAFKEIVIDIWKNNTGKILEQNQIINQEIEKLEQKKSKIYDLLEEGVYSGEEFQKQRKEVTQLIKEKESLLISVDSENINIEEALEYCFDKIRQCDQTWLEYEEDHQKRLRFQNFIFSENLEFSGQKFGTRNLSPIFSIYQQYLADSSCLVTHISESWNSLLKILVLSKTF